MLSGERRPRCSEEAAGSLPLLVVSSLPLPPVRNHPFRESRCFAHHQKDPTLWWTVATNIDWCAGAVSRQSAF